MKLDRLTNNISKTIQQFNRECAQEKIKRAPNLHKKYEKRIQNYGIDMNFKIGQGTFSKVYKGKDMIENGEVAVKIVQLKKIKEMGIQQLFWEELNIIKRLRHPNIVSCYEYFRTNNNCYTIYEFCQNGDLSKRLKKGNLGDKEDINQANTIIKDVFQGLLYLQSMSIVHRDIKAANILLAKGKAKIGDFGFATHCKRQFKDVSIGSPAYMAPEGLIHNIYGPKTDVWAFGMLIYQILHGLSPFHNCQSQQELKQKVQIPVNWDQLRCSLPSQLKRLILKCLKVQFQQRPTFSQLLNDQYIQKIYHQCSTYRNITKSNFSKLTSDSEEINHNKLQNRNRMTQRKSINPFAYNYIQQKNNQSNEDQQKNYGKITLKTQSNQDYQHQKPSQNIERTPQIANNNQEQNNKQVQKQQTKQPENPFVKLSVQKFTILIQQFYNEQILNQYIKIAAVFKKTLESHKKLIQKQNLYFFPHLINRIIIQIYCKANTLIMQQIKHQIQTQLSLEQMPQQLQFQFQNAKQISTKIDNELFTLIKTIQLQIDHQDIDNNKNHINQKQILIQTGNLTIICLQIIYNFNNQQRRNYWIKNYEADIKESDQFYIWLYELQLKRMEMTQM